MKIHYNSPVVLTFALVSTGLLVIDALLAGSLMRFFVVGPTMNPASPVDWFRLFSHVLGHASVPHLMGNMMLLLLVGPILEEKYGSARLLAMIGLTAVVTGGLNLLLFDSGLLGASGVVFMFILLSSITNARDGHLPLTLVLVVILFLGQEIVRGIGDDGVSQFAHVVGGLCGAGFGLVPGMLRRR